MSTIAETHRCRTWQQLVPISIKRQPILVGITSSEGALDKDCGEIVFLLSSLGEIQNCVVKLGDDHLVFAVAELSYSCGEPFVSEIFSRAVLPFKKAIGDEKHDVTGLHAELDRHRVPQIRQDSQGKRLRVQNPERLVS